MEPKAPDWEISKLYSQAFEIIKKNKLLWILGLAAAGSSFNYRSVSNTNFSNFFNHPQQPSSPNLPHSENFTNVLGAATSSPFTESIKAIFANIPFYYYLILGLEVFTLLLISIVIGIIYSALAQGLLLQSTFDTAEGKKAAIESASKKVLPKLKSLIWLQIVPGLVLALASALTFIILGILSAALPGVAKAIPIILIIVAIGAFIYWLIHLSLAQIWAPRKILMENLSGKEAFWSGLRVARKKFWASLLLGLVNNILVLLVIGIPLAFLVGVVLAGVFSTKAVPGLTIFLLILLIPLAIATTIGLMLLSGALNAFKAVVWTLAYKNLRRSRPDLF